MSIVPYLSSNSYLDLRLGFQALETSWKEHCCSWALSTRVRNRRELHASLKGATLGDPDGDTEGTLKWIKKAKKREKELAKKRQEELERIDKAIQEEYSESMLLLPSACNCWPLNYSHVLRGLGRPQSQS